MKKTIYILLSGLILLAACQDHDRISRGKFVKILTDMYLYENEISLMLGPQADSTHIYYSVFAKYNVTKAQFDSTMSYYSLHPRELENVYEDVNKRLISIKDKIDEGIALADQKNNLWKGSNKYTLQQDGKPKVVDFDIKITEPGIYQMRATVRYYADDSTVAPHMSAFLMSKNSPDSIDQKRIDFTRGDTEKDYTLTFMATDSSIIRMAGYWLNVDDLQRKNIQHIQIHKLQIKKIGSTQAQEEPVLESTIAEDPAMQGVEHTDSIPVKVQENIQTIDPGIKLIQPFHRSPNRYFYEKDSSSLPVRSYHPADSLRLR